jgi:mRNA-degrading endonuclease toxin of MazEF toxin-antitoxin module
MTSETGGYRRWDVAVALFPFTQSDQRKPRPILILSDIDFNQSHEHVIAAMITTGANTQWPSDHAIRDLVPTGLSHSSVVRWKVFTLPVETLARRIGTFGSSDRGLLSAGMAGILLG